MRTFLAITLFCALLIAHSANADEVLAIIVHRKSPISTMSRETLKQIFLRRILLDSFGNRWVPLNLLPTDAIRRNFSLALFKQLPEDQENYWNEQYFQGITPPEVMESEEAVVRFVEKTPGALGYVQKSKVDNRVKLLTEIKPPTN